METMNKASANITTITTAEKLYTRLQQNEKSTDAINVEQEGLPSRLAEGARVDLAAG